MRIRLLAGAVAGTMLFAGCMQSARPAAQQPKNAPPLASVRAAFFYPWFPESWAQQGIVPFTRYHPTSGLYDSSNLGVIDRQIRQMQYGHIRVGISSWQGPGTPTDRRVPALLSRAAGRDFKWALYYESEGGGDPSSAKIVADLDYLLQRYASTPAYERSAGKPVLFVYDTGDRTACDKLARWHAASATARFYIVQKISPGYQNCPYQPDSWHQYDPASPTDEVRGSSFNVSPGFFKAGEAAPRLNRDVSRFTEDLRKMAAAREPWHLITTFNEWGEGTALEPANEWASASGYGRYLDALHAVPEP